MKNEDIELAEAEKKPAAKKKKKSTASSKKKPQSRQRAASPDRRPAPAAPKKKQKAFDGGAAFKKEKPRKKPKPDTEKQEETEEEVLHARTEKPLLPIWAKLGGEKPLLPILSGRNKNKKLKKTKPSRSGETVKPIWTENPPEQEAPAEVVEIAENIPNIPEEQPVDEALERAVGSLAEEERSEADGQGGFIAPEDEEEGFSPERRPRLSERPKKKSRKERRAERKAAKAAKEPEPVDMKDFEKLRTRRRNMRRLRRLLIVLAIALCAAGLYYTKDRWVPKLEGILDKKHETIINDGKVQSGNFPIDLGDSTTAALATLDDDLICVDVGLITTYDQNGKVRTTDYHSFGSPVARTAGKRMLVFDNDAKSFRLLNKNGEVYSKKTDNIIIYGAVAENGNVLLVTLDEKYTALLTVYNKDGEQIYRWGTGDRITDASFAEDGDACVVSTFNVAQGAVTSKINRIDLTKSDAVLSSKPLEGCVIRVQENSDERIWAATSDRLYLLTDVCSYIDTFEFSGELVSMDMCSECACIATQELGHDKTRVCVFSADDNKAEPAASAAGTGRIRRVHCFEDMAMVLTNDKLDAYASDGSLAATSSLDDDYSDFVYFDEAVYLLGRREINKIIFNT